MPSTPRLGHSYPEKNERDWFSAFESFALSLDSADFSSRDDRNISVSCKGDVHISGNGTISWSGDILLSHGSSGFSGVIPADNSGVTLEDGDTAYVNVVRSPNREYEPELKINSGSIPNNNNSFVLFCRKEDKVWFRDNGVSKLGYGFGSFGSVVSYINLSSNERQGEGSRILGRTRVDFNGFTYMDAEVSYNLGIDTHITSELISGKVSIFDVTNGDELIHDFRVEDVEPELLELILGTDKTGERVLEIRGGLLEEASSQVVELEVLKPGDGAEYIFEYNNDDNVFSHASSSDETASDIASSWSSEIDGHQDLNAESDGNVVIVSGEPSEQFNYNAHVNGGTAEGDYLNHEETQKAAKGPPYEDDERMILWYSRIDIVAEF